MSFPRDGSAQGEGATEACVQQGCSQHPSIWAWDTIHLLNWRVLMADDTARRVERDIGY